MVVDVGCLAGGFSIFRIYERSCCSKTMYLVHRRLNRPGNQPSLDLTLLYRRYKKGDIQSQLETRLHRSSWLFLVVFV